MSWRFGRAVVSAEDHARCREARSRRNACQRRAANLKRKVEESLRQQRAAKGERERKWQRLADVFDRTMKEPAARRRAAA